MFFCEFSVGLKGILRGRRGGGSWKEKIVFFGFVGRKWWRFLERVKGWVGG